MTVCPLIFLLASAFISVFLVISSVGIFAAISGSFLAHTFVASLESLEQESLDQHSCTDQYGVLVKH